MGIFDGIRSLFAGKGGVEIDGAPDRGAAVEHRGFTIIPAPRRREGQFLTAGIIEKEVEGELKTAEFVRADTFASEDEAKRFAIVKGKQIVDYEGDRVFEGDRPR